MSEDSGAATPCKEIITPADVDTSTNKQYLMTRREKMCERAEKEIKILARVQIILAIAMMLNDIGIICIAIKFILN